MGVSSVNKIGRYTTAISDASRTLLGKKLSRAASARAVSAVGSSGMTPMKNGSNGTIKKAKMPAMLHRGEVVLTAGQVKSLKKILK